MHYVISKAKWLRNRTNDPNRPKGYRYPGGQLLNKQGMMCCLGFCALQKGASEDDIRGKSLPSDVERLLPGLNRKNPQIWDNFVDTGLSNNAAGINDSKSDDSKSDFSTDEKKIAALTKLFKKHGHTIEFVD